MQARARERMFRSIVPALKVIGAAALLTPLPQTVHAQSRAAVARTGVPSSPIAGEIADRASRELRPFYAARQFRPLWLNEFGRPSGAASMLMHHLRTSPFDGVDPKKLRFNRVAKLVDRARRAAEFVEPQRSELARGVERPQLPARAVGDLARDR